MRLLSLLAVLALAAAQQPYLDLLNGVRAKVYPTPSTPLAPLQWSEELAARAGRYVSNCTLRRDPSNRWLRSETVYATYGTNVTSQAAVAAWAQERNVFAWSLNNAPMAQNFTAITWQNTTSVGCARYSKCGAPLFTLYYCVFYPRGNWPGLYPYAPSCVPAPNWSCGGRCGNQTDGCKFYNCGSCVATIPGDNGQGGDDVTGEGGDNKTDESDANGGGGDDYEWGSDPDGDNYNVTTPDGNGTTGDDGSGNSNSTTGAEEGGPGGVYEGGDSGDGGGDGGNTGNYDGGDTGGFEANVTESSGDDGGTGDSSEGTSTPSGTATDGAFGNSTTNGTITDGAIGNSTTTDGTITETDEGDATSAGGSGESPRDKRQDKPSQSTTPCYTLKRCGLDNPKRPIMNGLKFIDTTGMTVDVCVNFCAARSYNYAGLTDGSTCLCDSGYDGGPLGTCDTRCSATANQFCGGSGSVQIYNVQNCQPTASDATARPCMYSGCYQTSQLNGYESSSGPNFQYKTSINTCASRGFTYLAITGTVIYCTNDLVGDPISTGACPNNPKTCGDGHACGSWNNDVVSVYTTTGCFDKGYTYSPEFDWRSRGDVVGNVQNQPCSNCWAYASTGAIESAWAVATNTPVVPLSQSEMTVCASGGASGCITGGTSDIAFQWFRDAGGQFVSTPSSETYGSTCPATTAGLATSMKGPAFIPKTAPFSVVRARDENAMKYALQFGPAYIGIVFSEPFSTYTSGIYTYPDWRNNNAKAGTHAAGHAMLVVGYGTDKTTNQDYWIIRNSWDTTWGINGYSLWARNQDNTGGIANDFEQPNIYIPVSDDPFATGKFTIKSVTSGKCIARRAPDTSAYYTTADCDSTDTLQRWSLINNGINQQYRIVVESQNTHLDAWDRKLGASTVISNDNANTDLTNGLLHWFVVPVGKYYRITNLATSYSLYTAPDTIDIVAAAHTTTTNSAQGFQFQISPVT